MRSGLLLSVLAILLRLAVASRREGIEVDGITYLNNARALVEGLDGFTVIHPPLYSVVLAPWLGLSGDAEWLARVVSAVLGGLWVWPTLWLAGETTDRRVAWLAGLFVAVTPSAVEASTRVLAEPIFGLCLTTFLWVLIRALRTGSLVPAALAGVLGGLATLSRPEGIAYMALAWALLVFAPVLVAPRSPRSVLAGLAALTLLWFAVMVPYMALVRRQTGDWHWSGKLGQTLLVAESVGDERSGAAMERAITATPDELPTSLIGYVLTHPRAVVSRMVINLHLLDKYVLPGLLQSIGIALVALGLLQLRYRRRTVPPEWFLATAPLPLCGLLLFVVESRYFVSIIPVFGIVAAIGLRRLQGPDGVGSRLSTRSWILLVVALLSFVPWIVRPWFRQDPAAIQKETGLWLKSVAGPGTVFIGRYPVISFYAEGLGLPFARVALDDLLKEGRARGARFLIVDSVRLPDSRPDLLGLVAGDRSRPDLELAKVVEDRAGRRVVVYQIRDG